MAIWYTNSLSIQFNSMLFVDRATQKKLALDSMYKLEHGTDDQARGKSSAPTIAKVVELQAAHKDDFRLNQLARKQFRVRWLCCLCYFMPLSVLLYFCVSLNEFCKRKFWDLKQIAWADLELVFFHIFVPGCFCLTLITVFLLHISCLICSCSCSLFSGWV